MVVEDGLFCYILSTMNTLKNSDGFETRRKPSAYVLEDAEGHNGIFPELAGLSASKYIDRKLRFAAYALHRAGDGEDQSVETTDIAP